MASVLYTLYKIDECANFAKWLCFTGLQYGRGGTQWIFPSRSVPSQNSLVSKALWKTAHCFVNSHLLPPCYLFLPERIPSEFGLMSIRGRICRVSRMLVSIVNCEEEHETTKNPIHFKLAQCWVDVVSTKHACCLTKDVYRSNTRGANLAININPWDTNIQRNRTYSWASGCIGDKEPLGQPCSSALEQTREKASVVTRMDGKKGTVTHTWFLRFQNSETRRIESK